MRRRDPNSVIKVIDPTADYVNLPRSFAQDHNLSPFTRSCALDLFSRSGDYETNVATIMSNFKCGRDKAEKVLRELCSQGYAHARDERDGKGKFVRTVYHLCAWKERLRKFVDNQEWVGENVHALKNQGEDEAHALIIQALDIQALDSDDNENKEITKLKNEPKHMSEVPSDVSVDLDKAIEIVRAAGVWVPDRGTMEVAMEQKGKKEPKRQKGATRKPRSKAREYTEAFGMAWSAYPTTRNMSKAVAFDNWQREDCEPQADLVIEAMKAYALDCRKNGTPDDKKKHMQGWITERRWEGYVAQSANSNADQTKSIINAIACDLDDGHRDELVMARKWFPRLKDVPESLRQMAEDLARSFSPSSQGALA